jgi:DUF438 domain-containing protein
MDRIAALTGILERLNGGEDPAKVKAEAKELLATIDPADLSIAEQELVEKGLDPEDLRKLCPLHLELLEDQSDKLREKLPREHVISTLISEHETILCFLDDLDFVNQSIQKMTAYEPGRVEFRRLQHIAEQLISAEPHHQREEEILFPELEKRGVYGPPMVMKGEHTEMRRYKRKLLELAKSVSQMEYADFARHLDGVVRFIVPMLREHIYKENNILYPTALEVIDNTEVWRSLKVACDKIGYCCFKPAG